MVQGTKGMGSHKHAISGRSPRSPKYKQQRTREANQQAEEDRARRHKPPVFRTLAEAMAARKHKKEQTNGI